MSFLARIWLKNEFLGEKRRNCLLGGKLRRFQFFPHAFLCFFFLLPFILLLPFFVLVLALSQKRIIKEIEGLSENGESK